MSKRVSDSTSGEEPAIFDQATNTSQAEKHDDMDRKKWNLKRRLATGTLVVGLGAGAVTTAITGLGKLFEGDVKSERADSVLAFLQLPDLTVVDGAKFVDVPCPTKSKESSITFRFNGGTNNQQPTLIMNETTGVKPAHGTSIVETSKEKNYLLADPNERQQMLSRVAELCLIVSGGQHTPSNNTVPNPNTTTSVIG